MKKNSFPLILFVVFFKRSEPVANRQYVLMYPSYQLISTRQDAPGQNPFQTFLGIFGFGQTGQNTQTTMDAADKPEAQAQPQSQPQALNSIDNVSLEKSKQNLYYTFATPASTVPLNADQRFIYLAEQPQLFGSAVNPVFNLQPVPVVLSRSNVAQPNEPLVQSNKVNSENVQKFSQIPPVMAVGVEPVSLDVQGKSAVVNELVAAVVDSVNVKQHQDEPVADSKVNPLVPLDVVVEDNRAVPVPEEPSAKSATVVETRSNPIPLVVSNEAVVVPVVSSPVNQVVEVKESVPEVGSVLKELNSVPQVDAGVVVPATVVAQNVQLDEKVHVEQDVKQV